MFFTRTLDKIFKLFLRIGMIALSTANVCQLGQERDENGLIQSILTKFPDESCECIRVIIGGFNIWTPKRPHALVMDDSSLRSSSMRFEHYKLRCKGIIYYIYNNLMPKS